MQAEWMANVGGKEYGPFTWDQMLQMASEGRVTPDLSVRKARDAQWSSAAAIPGLLDRTKSAPPTPASKATTTASIAAGKPPVKAKPAAPPAGRTVPPVVVPPQNIPAHIPGGTPVGVAVGIAAPPPIALFNIDVGASPSGKMRSVKLPPGDDHEKVVVKKRSTVVIVGVLGGAMALVSAIVGVSIFIVMNRGGTDEKLTTNTSTPSKEAAVDEGEAISGEENPEGAPRATGKVAKESHPAKKLVAAKGTNAPPSQDADQKLAQAAVKSVPEKNWIVVATGGKLIIGNAEIAISRTWLAQNEQGERAAGSPEAPAKYLFVELLISNRAGSVLKYKSWNETSKNPVFLIDESDQLYQLIPASSTPDVARLPKTDIPGGESVSEVLVFEAPPGSFESLRMLLPQKVFYDRTKNPYFGIEITPDVLGNEGGRPVAVPLPRTTGDKADDPLVNSRKAPPGPANPEPQKKPPSLFDKVNKYVASEEKGKKTDEGKGTEPAKGNEPVSKSEPAKTTEPAPGTEPTKPSEPAKTAEPENPFQPVKPKSPAKPDPARPPGKK